MTELDSLTHSQKKTHVVKSYCVDSSSKLSNTTHRPVNMAVLVSFVCVCVCVCVCTENYTTGMNVQFVKICSQKYWYNLYTYHKTLINKTSLFVVWYYHNLYNEMGRTGFPPLPNKIDFFFPPNLCIYLQTPCSIIECLRICLYFTGGFRPHKIHASFTAASYLVSWYSFASSTWNNTKVVKQSRYRPEVPRRFQEVKVPRFNDNGQGWW